jgi:hypothetical protein
MPTLSIKMDLQRMNELLQSESGRAYFVSRYPEEMDWYDQNISSGLGCPVVQAILMGMWQQEMERDAKSVSNRLDGRASA